NVGEYRQVSQGRSRVVALRDVGELRLPAPAHALSLGDAVEQGACDQLVGFGCQVEVGAAERLAGADMRLLEHVLAVDIEPALAVARLEELAQLLEPPVGRQSRRFSRQT